MVTATPALTTFQSTTPQPAARHSRRSTCHKRPKRLVLGSRVKPCGTRVRNTESGKKGAIRLPNILVLT